MILYVNGDSHSAGAELARCVDGQLLSFKDDDSAYWRIKGTPEGREAHPCCLALSYGQLLANKLGADFECDAIAGSSNHRIIRTTWNRIQGVQAMPIAHPDLVVIGWSTWERKEFYDNETGINWQVNAGGIGSDWPKWLRDEYPKFIAGIDWANEIRHSHSKIHQFHLDLKRRGIRHLFFNTFNHFDTVHTGPTYTWDDSYINPYDPTGTYYEWCVKNGFKTVTADSYHFGADAHAAWSEYLYNQIVQMYLTAKS